jgi:lysophospholipase L1-like esterase
MSLKLAILALPALLLSTLAASAQQPAPSAVPAAKPAEPAPRPNLIGLIGFGRYEKENADLAAAPLVKPRYVLMGDSITEGWKKADPTLFADGHYIDRGISGQTTPQMLLRFRDDVLALHPAAVAILAGTNDLAGNTGPETVEMIEGNIASMAEIAHANHIAVVISSITPTDHYPWKPGVLPAPDIHTINAWLAEYSAEHHFVYLDYFSALAQPDGTMPKASSGDGVHPTAAGFAIMRPLLEKAIAKAVHDQK